MASICTRCAIRLHKAAQVEARTAATRTLSTTASRRRHGVPTFTETSQPELDDVLQSMRSKQFIPAALSTHEQKLMFGTKWKQYLIDNPQVVSVGDEDVELYHINRRSELPNRNKLFLKAIELMRNGEQGDWKNLPPLLAGLKRMKKEPNDGQLAKIVRIATNCGRFGTILQCLHQAEHTGMTLKKPEILDAVMTALRQIAYSDGWSEPSTLKALRDANEVALQLEDEDHGSGKFLQENDARRRPEVISVFLELAAVYAQKHQEGKDVDGKVKAYAERLLANVSDPARTMRPSSTTPAKTGPQLEMHRGVPIWHGLRLAMDILGNDMPKPTLAQQIVNQWGIGLTILYKALQPQKQAAKEGSYADQALKMWQDCGGADLEAEYTELKEQRRREADAKKTSEFIEKKKKAGRS